MGVDSPNQTLPYLPYHQQQQQEQVRGRWRFRIHDGNSRTRASCRNLESLSADKDAIERDEVGAWLGVQLDLARSDFRPKGSFSIFREPARHRIYNNNLSSSPLGLGSCSHGDMLCLHCQVIIFSMCVFFFLPPSCKPRSNPV